ncbi:DNA repair protein RAD16 [Pleurotus ostreatus]|nr:DNA repair protein RAD16 [Pleurotus ostreatus]
MVKPAESYNSMVSLLPYHKSIIERIHDPATNDLLVLARGLGLRRILCTLMKIYDSPKNLVLLLNASQEEESEIGEELGLMGCRNPGLRIVDFEKTNKERQDLYKKGGLISVTSRILVVDMLQANIPTELISGIIVLHAEKVTALVLEAFIVRLYREKNRTGFLKAFTDQPEHITSGLSPLKNIMKELQLRSVHIYPRFHQEIKKSLERRRADVIELSQPLTTSMSEIHQAIIQCITTTLSELRRSNTSLDLDDFNVENAYFRSFDIIVRRQLDSVWHKVGPKTKQLVNDLGTLRRLLTFLLSYDCLQFQAYLETLVASSTTSSSGGAKQHPSPWMVTDAANIIFQAAKRRCYTMSSSTKAAERAQMVSDVDEEGWDALDEIHGIVGKSSGQSASKADKPFWVPQGMEPVLEELPKWTLLADILKEIEGEIIRQESLPPPTVPSTVVPGTNTVLVMTSSTREAEILSDFLSAMDADAPAGTQGRKMMLRKLYSYLAWKGKLNSQQRNDGTTFQRQSSAALSEALKKKDREKAERSAGRRRVRGGAPSSAAASSSVEPTLIDVDAQGDSKMEADSFAEFWAATQNATAAVVESATVVDADDLDFTSTELLVDFDTSYGLLTPEETVVVRPYSDDGDDSILGEMRPKFIVMFEPNMDFIRRIEVYKSSNPGLGVRVYHMVYGDSCEEHKYLVGIRKEKESFERLIKERATMLLPILEDKGPGSTSNDALLKTISSRIAGGRREISTTPAQVIVDMREFRSTLPSLLHASNIIVVPATLTVGDYILTPDICVERKSLSDLISSFNSGRLYTQCELMSVHYKHPVLLIEFEEDKAFSLEIVSDMKSYVKPTAKYPQKKGGGIEGNQAVTTLQSKIVLLLLHFPRVRIIWASSPYATVEIFQELKQANPEPDPVKAISVGAEDDAELGAGINSAAEELLRSLPGITAKNVHYVMSKAKNVREFCGLCLGQVQEILGNEPGKLCWEFMHRGE